MSPHHRHPDLKPTAYTVCLSQLCPYSLNIPHPGFFKLCQRVCGAGTGVVVTTWKKGGVGVVGGEGGVIFHINARTKMRPCGEVMPWIRKGIVRGWDGGAVGGAYSHGFHNTALKVALQLCSYSLEHPPPAPFPKEKHMKKTKQQKAILILNTRPLCFINTQSTVRIILRVSLENKIINNRKFKKKKNFH